MPSLTTALTAPVNTSDPSIGPPQRVESCPGCQKIGVPLLPCDDPPPKDASGNGAPQKLRFCADCMIGKKVRVFWPVDNSWYTGVVQEYNAETGEHLLKYDDDDTEWVKIGESGSGAAGQTTSGSHGGSPSRTSSGERISPIPAGPLPGDPYAEGWQQGRPPYPPYTAAQGQPPPGMPYPPMYGYPPGHPAGPGYPPGIPYRYPPPPMMMPVPSAGRPLNDNGPAKGPKSAAHEEATSPTPSDASLRKKGPRVWSKEEDALLLTIVSNMRMPMKWSVVAQSIPGRTGKQCRERYVNHLNPRLKTSDWNPVEDATIFHLYSIGGSHWAKMAKMIPGRTDNGIKNRFHNLRRQLEREDRHRLRLSKSKDYPNEIRLERLRRFPIHLKGKADELWNMHRGLGVLAAQSVISGAVTRHKGRFGPFRAPEMSEMCGRCGLLVPSVQCGKEICTTTGWCQGCTRIPPHISGNLLRECLNLRRCQDKDNRGFVESWEELVVVEDPGEYEEEDEKNEGDDGEEGENKEETGDSQDNQVGVEAV